MILPLIADQVILFSGFLRVSFLLITHLREQRVAFSAVLLLATSENR